MKKEKNKKIWKKARICLLLIMIFVSVLSGCINHEEQQITETPNISWDVSCVASDTDLVTVNNDAGMFSILVYANTTSNALYYKDNITAYSIAPTLSFTCRLLNTDTSMLTDTGKGATGKVHITDPGKVCDSGSAYLFSRVPGKTRANLPWVCDGVSKYEINYITVSYGASEVANLTLNLNEVGIANSNAVSGDDYIFYLTVCGSTWTGRISIINVFA